MNLYFKYCHLYFEAAFFMFLLVGVFLQFLLSFYYILGVCSMEIHLFWVEAQLDFMTFLGNSKDSFQHITVYIIIPFFSFLGIDLFCNFYWETRS